MFLLLFLLSLLSFSLYFYGIGLWYLSFLPILFVLGVMIYYGSTRTVSVKFSDVLNKYSLLFARIIIMFGLLGIVRFFGVDLLQTFLFLIGLNIILWFGSYIFGYEDGKKIFPSGYYLLWILLFFMFGGDLGWSGLYQLFFYFSAVHFALLGFLIFVIGTRKSIPRAIFYEFGIFVMMVLFLVVFERVPYFYLALTINITLLSALYFGLYTVLQNIPKAHDKQVNISVRRILAGERITGPKYVQQKFLGGLYDYIHTIPFAVKSVLEFFNIGLLAILIFYYVVHISTFGGVDQIFYWLIIALFVGNVLMLKKAGFTSIIQNLFVFLVIYFALYVSLFSYFNGNFGSVVLRGILWNLISNVLLFYSPRFLPNVFKKIDYSYWMVAMLISLVVNVLLLLRSGWSGELVFFLVLLYLGVQGMLLFYGMKFVTALEE